MKGLPCDVMSANCCPATAAAMAALKLAAADDGEEWGGNTEGWRPAPGVGNPLPGPCAVSELGL